MAKVTGPLYSMSASGSIAKSMVFFPWKGVNAVRAWVTPANPMTSGQGNTRIALGGTGRAVGQVDAGKQFAQQLIDLGLIPSGQTKQSFLVKYIIDHYLDGSTAYAASLAALTGHAVYTTWGALATTLGIVEFDLPYATYAPYDKALGLYLLAASAIALGFTGTPYTTALASWTATQITAFGADLTS